MVGKAGITETVGTDAPQTDETRGENVWVMKLDKNLTPIWSRTYGSSKNDVGSCVVETENGFVIAGTVGTMDGDVTPKPYSGSNAWFLKLDGQMGENVHQPGDGTGGVSPSAKGGSIYLQVGAYSGDSFRIDYADMRTTAVFGKNTVLNVMSYSDANEAISLCDQAIDYVSKQRSRYGSYQNALEHLYAANAVTGENVSASESLLSDADMADEMVSFSRDKILEQANLAVMAQANTANQAVLRLLT